MNDFGAFNTAKTIVELFSLAQDLTQRAYAEFRKRQIIVLGYSGAGKTDVLSKILQARLTQNLTESTIEDEVSLTRKLGKIYAITDTPGNVSRFHVVKKLLPSVDSGDICGIINVVAAGYNESRTDRTGANRNPHTPWIGDEVNENYLEWERERDLQFLDAWLDQVDTTEQVGWVLTLVNKYDLWLRDVGPVLDYYGPDGPYGSKICHKFSSGKYRHFAVCATTGRFFGGVPRSARIMPLADSGRSSLNKDFLDGVAAFLSQRELVH